VALERRDSRVAGTMEMGIASPKSPKSPRAGRKSPRAKGDKKKKRQAEDTIPGVDRAYLDQVKSILENGSQPQKAQILTGVRLDTRRSLRRGDWRST